LNPGVVMAERSNFPRTHLRVAAVGDIHVSRHSQGAFQPLFAQINNTADVLLLCGDFTDYGLPDEARVLARELTAALKLPVLAVLGNHDYEAGKHHEIREILMDGGVTVREHPFERCRALLVARLESE
jgi:predicted MPP superfamily phosphohydrolase